MNEVEQISGGSWGDVWTAVGGISAITAGTVYTIETGGIGGYLGGGSMIIGGLGAISSAFTGFYSDVASYYTPIYY